MADTVKMDMVSCPVCSTRHLPRKGTLSNGVYACTCENCGHFFKFNAIQEFRSTATFTINGLQYTAGNEYNPATSLVEYMRQTGVSVGTKGCCYEGGCGVCMVTVKLLDPVSGKKVDHAVNSCCLQLFTCDGLEITTIEGLGSPRKGLHPIQDRLAQYNGSQCGFCSPAQVMHMYGMLQKNPTPTVQKIEDEFDATICRCTGYRSILDAMKSFAVDAPAHLKGGLIDIEDLDGKLCKKTGLACSGQCGTKKSGNAHSDRCEHQVDRPLHIVGDTAQWLKPTTLDQLVQTLNTHRDDNYRMVFGNTGFGVYKEFGPWNFGVLIDIRGIQDLYSYNFGQTITLGANLSVANLQELFESKKTDATIPYAATFAQHLTMFGHHGIRNMSSWAGNLMLKRAHPEFPSDIFVLLETVSAQLVIYDGDGTQQTYSLLDFLSLDMKGKVIVSVVLPTYQSTSVQVRTMRTAQRLQGCQSYVNAGFNFDIDESKNYTVNTRPTIVVQGINGTTFRAQQTESYLEGMELGDPEVLKHALGLLSAELVPESYPNWGDPLYRRSLAVAMFYKFVLGVCKSASFLDPRYVSGGVDLTRTPLMGTQDFDTVKTEYPVTEPMTKTIEPYLTSGVARFLDDLPRTADELCAAVVVSSVANATIDTIDASLALTLPGVVAFILASDIPQGGSNSWQPGGFCTNELLSTGQIKYAGQPIGVIVADIETTAQTAASMVNVTYKDIQAPIVDLKDGVQKKAFFPNPLSPTTIGDAAAAIAAAPHKISGNVSCGDQYHFYLESQTAICIPTDVGGMKVKASSQQLDTVLQTVAKVLGLPESDVTVEVERLGGGFGGKTSQNNLVSGLCALAAYVTNRPVKLHLDIHTNMKMLGKRTAYYAEYQVGSDNDGKLAGVEITIYADMGGGYTSARTGSILRATKFIDNAYYCPNWTFTPIPVKTNKPITTACRAPGSIAYIFVIETIMEHLAKSLGKDPLEVRKINLYAKGQIDPTGQPLDYCTIQSVVTTLETDVDLAKRKTDIDNFNKANRWKKKGIAVMPNKYGISWGHQMYNTDIIIHHGDGSVVVAHGGIDMGQGINTKVIQVCAYEFGIPMDKIRVKTSSSDINANSGSSAGSRTSELCSLSVIEACKILKDRMAPVKARMDNPTWEELVARCYSEMVDLTASYMTHPSDPYASHYSCYSATCVEAELDVLTGQYQLRQMDMLYDCGQSTNPELDIGQAEGGFVMGLGYFLQEYLNFDPQTGQVLNDGTWYYKPPLPKDLPMNFNIKFQRNAPNPLGVLGAKAVGEPPVTMSCAALFAIKHAIEAARAEVGSDAYFALDAPATVEKVQAQCLNTITNFTYGL